MPRDSDKTILDRPEQIPQVAWFGNWKFWFGAAIVIIVGVLIYAAL